MISQLPKEFLNRMKKLLGEEYGSFAASYQTPARRGLRVNTIKCGVDRFCRIFPYSISRSPFCSEGFYLDDDIRAGAEPLHHAGAYYMQEPSATSAVAVLNPRPGERVLDLCAAPGGKSTQIAAALKGSGLLWANEVIRARADILAQNIERCGVRNAVVSSIGANVLCKRLANLFDAVLVDAPCSGEGMFKKEPDAILHWSEENIRFCAGRQLEILLSAADSVKQGGRLVYSTCTFAPEENEIVIAQFLNLHPDFELVNIGGIVSFGRPGFSWDRVKDFSKDLAAPPFPLEFTRRIFPVDGGEGHFIALIRRTAAADNPVERYRYNTKDENSGLFRKLYSEIFSGEPYGIIQTTGGTIRLLPEQLPDLRNLGVISAGVAGAKLQKNRLEPCHAIFMAAKGEECNSILDLKYDDPRLTSFLKGEQVKASDCSGWTAVAVEGVVAGFGKASGGMLNNKYPKGLRLRTGQ